MPGSLTIIGLGPGRPEWMTLEAADLLREAATTPKAVAYGFPSVRALAHAVAPALTLRDPRELAEGVAVRGGPPYAAIVQGLMRLAFAEGRDVLYLAPGNALVINDLVLALRRTCARYGKPVRVVAGMSFLDPVLERVFWHSERGLQLHSAWEVAAGRRVLEPRTPALLYELGERVAPGGAADDETREMLRALRDGLMRTYGPDHPLLMLHSSGDPEYTNSSQKLVLSALAESEVRSLSNLWIPAAGPGPARDRESTPRRARQEPS